MPLCTTKLLLDKSIEIELLQFMWFYDRLHRLNREATFFSRGQRMLQICWLSLIRNINRNQRYTNQSTPATSCKLTTWHGKKRCALTECFWITNKLKKVLKIENFWMVWKIGMFSSNFSENWKVKFLNGKIGWVSSSCADEFLLIIQAFALVQKRFSASFCDTHRKPDLSEYFPKWIPTKPWPPVILH